LTFSAKYATIKKSVTENDESILLIEKRRYLMNIPLIIPTILLFMEIGLTFILMVALVVAIITTIWSPPGIYATVPGETDLIYLKSTKSVQVRMDDESIIPFAPAYGYGGTYVYFIPEENKLVNENDVEVPGILRKVGDRPSSNDGRSKWRNLRLLHTRRKQ
jgi:hypothetical protein